MTGIARSRKGGKSLTSTYMTGSLRHYVIYIFVFFIAVLGGGLLLVDHIGFDMTDYAPMSFYEAVAILGLVIPVIVLPFVRTRLMAIILTGRGLYGDLVLRPVPGSGFGVDPDGCRDRFCHAVPALFLSSAEAEAGEGVNEPEVEKSADIYRRGCCRNLDRAGRKRGRTFDSIADYFIKELPLGRR